MPGKVVKTLDFFSLFDTFIKYSENGKRLQKNGKKLRSGSVKNYFYLRKLLHEFSSQKKFELRIISSSKLAKREFTKEKNYWKKFYNRFTDYLYNDLGHFDNYVGNNMKMLRVFFNFLNDEMGLSTGAFHKNFYVRKEEIQIIALLPEQLNFLIYDKEFENNLEPYLQKTKDIFVFGSTVALRVSDLLNLKKTNLEIINNEHYLKVLSKKTQTFTRIKLPNYAVEILKKYKNRYKTLLPPITNGRLNLNVKKLMEKTNWTDSVIKTRERRGIQVPVYKNAKSKKHYRFCDMITSHSMRRTAITTMLSLGMPEHIVREISGHAANSKEFFRYVKLSQAYKDRETEVIFEKLMQKKLVDKLNALA
jgi:integrase